MSWGAQNRSKDAKTPTFGLAMSRKPKLALCGIQPYYIPFDGVESGMEILYYVSYHERTYPQYITERDMERKEPNETNGIWHADDSDAYVHYCNNFRQLATNVS